jgi:phage tail sheath protein FI
MASYLHPGVYIEEVPSGVMPIEGVGTSTACFVGYCVQGPIGVPVLISSWSDYLRTFGPLRDAVVDAGAAAPLADPMSSAVNAFFLNGGSAAYIVRLAHGAKLAQGIVNSGGVLMTVSAVNEGTWANGLVLRLTKKTLGAATLFLASVGTIAKGIFTALEQPVEVVPEAGVPTSIGPTIASTSAYVRVTVPAGQEAALRAYLAAPAAGFVDVPLTDVAGDDGTAPLAADFTTAFATLSQVRDINILLLPGQTWDNDSGQANLSQAVSHCEAMANRMLILDVKPGVGLTDENAVQALSLPTSTYAATYYPWSMIANPFYDANSNPAAPRTVLVSSAAIAAGLWAKTDLRRGVWKAPAGIEFGVLGVSGLEFTVGNDEQDFLNPQGVNALRRLPSFGQVVWGSRTLATRAKPEWRYVPVRRTAIFIEESIYNGIQWAVFEPNDARLWSALRANIESFMNGLFRAGAFQGAVAGDAYAVSCGLGSTMTQGDIDRGQVIVQVAFAPLKPAEFVIVRIQQKVGQQ